MRYVAIALCLALFSPLSLWAQDAPTALEVFPRELTIRGADDAPQVIVSARLANGRFVDVTDRSTFQVANPETARIDGTGRIFPLANGSTAIQVRFGELSQSLPVSVQGMDQPQPLNFINHIEPILTKFSCNSGGCHGKIQGQNGFRLSLLGFEPEFDYMTLLKESRGRRVMPTAPEQSLLLTKAAGQAPHGGGKKIDAASEEYKILRRWIATGMPYGQPDDPTISHVSVYPERRVLDRQARQQLVVLAHYSDGSVEDVTRRTQYESNETEIATVTETGVVQTLSLTGQAAVMVRFSGKVTVFRAVVPRPGTPPVFEFPEQTLVDRHTAAQWKQLGIAPSPLSSDEQFIRRVFLDITGTLPSAAEVDRFLKDSSAGKRDRLIDELVERPEYAYLFANKWADVLRVKRRNQPGRAAGTFGFHGWIRDAMARDMPYDQFVRAIVSASGDEDKNPPTVWYKEITNPELFVDDLSQVFLGQRLSCANCHHHPYEKWSQDDYWGLAAFYGRVGRKALPLPGVQANRDNSKQLIFVRASGGVTNKRTNQPAALKPLDADVQEIPAQEDPRDTLADWMTDPKNPFFARAVANRYWAHFFGRGIVDPLDDMRVTNPPANPELLDGLAEAFIQSGYSLKTLVKTICKSRTYQLSADPTESNQTDKQSFARYYPRRLPAEVVFDAVCQVTGSPSQFSGLPTDTNAPQRAVMLPDESFSSYFLEVFGRPQRVSACECERVNDASLAMTLHMLNSQDIQDKISRAGGTADLLAKDTRPDDDKVRSLFLAALGRDPSAQQLELARVHLTKHKDNPKQAYENIIWALINTKAFLFNQ